MRRAIAVGLKPKKVQHLGLLIEAFMRPAVAVGLKP
jgi:hypothetical protein